jgi:hypothetical protein
MNLLSVIAAVMVAITTMQHPTLIKAHTRLACVLLTSVDSASAQKGDVFKLRVDDPSHPYLNGAVIEGHVTHVWQPGGLQRAEIAFLFDDITFVNHAKNSIRAYVVSANVVQRETHTPGPAPMPNVPGAPNSSTIVWSTTLGAKTTQTSQTGGYAYAPRGGIPLAAQAGAPVTIELASDLQTP